jgi:hypothetical protein
MNDPFLALGEYAQGHYSEKSMSLANPNPPSPPSLLNQLTAALKSDPRKTWVLTILLTVMLVLWGRMMLGGHSPAEVLAGAPETSDISTGVVGHLSGHHGQRVPLAEWARQPAASLSRNLFSVPFDYYPQDGSRLPEVSRSNLDGGFWDDLAKSMSAHADQKKERQILIDNLRTQASDLSLEGTVLGSQPKAWVNGSLVGVGEQVGSSGFRVVKIEARGIVVEREGVRLEVPMK